jgi:CheY-like chemotaxis protein
MPRSLRVLVVEDSQDTRDGLCLMRERGGPVRLTLPLTVQTAAACSTWRLRFANPRSERPTYSGFQVEWAIAQQRPHLHPCAFIAYASARDREQTKIAGFDRLIAKGSPTSITELEAQSTSSRHFSETLQTSNHEIMTSHGIS